MKAQLSIEFIILISILLIIFTVFLFSGTSTRSRLIGIKSRLEAKELSDSIAFEINTAVRAGNGYERRFYVKDSLFGVSDFSISVEGYYVFVDWDKSSVSSSVITDGIVGSMSKGWNMINNTNGVIHVK